MKIHGLSLKDFFLHIGAIICADATIKAFALLAGLAAGMFFSTAVGDAEVKVQKKECPATPLVIPLRI